MLCTGRGEFAVRCIKKAPHPMAETKGRDAISCYHLFSQTAHTACLIEYSILRYSSTRLRGAYPSQPTDFCSVRSSKRYSHSISMSLSSAGVFLFVFRNVTISCHRFYFLYSIVSALSGRISAYYNGGGFVCQGYNSPIRLTPT